MGHFLIEIGRIMQSNINNKQKSNSAVGAFWSPDGRTFATAVLNPRLRVDNHYKVLNHIYY